VRRLEALRTERTARRERLGNVRLALDAGERSGKRVAELEGVTKRFGDRTIVRDLTLNVMRGDRLALIGPNGAGKTTLLKLILGQMAPDAGTVRLGTNLEIAYFDQLREQLDPEQTVVNSIGDGTEFIEINGNRKHVLGYLQDFLFSPERARTPVKVLSGGERNRLLLARLFTQRFNVLVLDEPTNDLDIETLDLLEDLLLNLNATLLVVSHDRAFLDNVVTSTLVMEGAGRVGEFVGGYTDWQRQRAAAVRETAKPAATKATPQATTKSGKKKRLSHKEAMELAGLPDQIDAAEQERQRLLLSLATPGMLRDGAAMARAKAELVALDERIHALTGRWEALELLAAGDEG
jgi:ATP-binding cassette subfamily F protein uup